MLTKILRFSKTFVYEMKFPFPQQVHTYKHKKMMTKPKKILTAPAESFGLALNVRKRAHKHTAPHFSSI